MSIELPIIVNANLCVPIEVGCAMPKTPENSDDTYLLQKVSNFSKYDIGVDLRLEKYTNTSIAQVGEKIPCAIKVSNNGPIVANNITVVYEIEEGVFVEAIQISNGNIERRNNKIIWTIDRLNVGEKMLISVILIPMHDVANKFIVNIATLIADYKLLNPANAMDTTPIYIEKYSNLMLEKCINGCIIQKLEKKVRVLYKIIVRNNGPNVATDVIITDFMQKLNVICLESSKGKVYAIRNRVIWEIQNLSVGEEVEALVEVALIGIRNNILSKTVATSNSTILNPDNSTVMTNINIIRYE